MSKIKIAEALYLISCSISDDENECENNEFKQQHKDVLQLIGLYLDNKISDDECLKKLAKIKEKLSK